MTPLSVWGFYLEQTYRCEPHSCLNDMNALVSMLMTNIQAVQADKNRTQSKIWKQNMIFTVKTQQTETSTVQKICTDAKTIIAIRSKIPVLEI